MSSNCIFFGWNRSVPGREAASGQHFQEFNEYLGMLTRQGAIDSYDVVFLEPHGGDMNGFFLIRGEPAKLATLTAGSDWVRHMVRCAVHMQNAGAVRGVTGAEIPARMQMWMEAIPK